MNLRKLLTFTGAATLAVMPVATAQNPTILQGSYVSNVFGQSNFVKNPNAQTNTANVTLTTATATRSTTTPLVATSEYNVTITSANGTVAWDTRTFDEGMKNQNCEARFTYRGFQATSKAQIKQGANVVAELVLTPSATDPRIASINFPCGDLSSATTFVITDTATLAGTNEIGGIYVGLATNMANVAQAEGVVMASRSGAKSIPDSVHTTYEYTTEILDTNNEYNTTDGKFTAKRAGVYLITATVLWDTISVVTANVRQIAIFKNGVNVFEGYRDQAQTTATRYVSGTVTGQVNLNVGDYVEIKVYQFSGAARSTSGIASYETLSISRFPSSSELVVTPETQNVFAAAKWTGGSNTFISTNTRSAITGFTGYTSYGKASTTAPVSSMEMTVANIPPGAYKLSANLQLVAESQAAGTVDCYIDVSDDGGSTFTTLQGSTVTYGSAYSYTQVYGGSTFFNYTSLQSSKTFKIFVRKAGGTGQCRAQMDSSNTNIILEPLDNNANSALYVQGPVKAAGTGTAIPSGYVGEVKLATDGTLRIQSSPVYGTWYKLTTTELTLEPGVWQICFFTLVQGQYTTPAGSYPSIATAVFDLTSSPNQILYLDAEVGPDINASNEYIYSNAGKCQVNRFTQTTNIGLRTRLSAFAGSPAFSNLRHRCDTFQCWLQATRIN